MYICVTVCGSPVAPNKARAKQLEARLILKFIVINRRMHYFYVGLKSAVDIHVSLLFPHCFKIHFITVSLLSGQFSHSPKSIPTPVKQMLKTQSC